MKKILLFAVFSIMMVASCYQPTKIETTKYSYHVANSRVEMLETVTWTFYENTCNVSFSPVAHTGKWINENEFWLQVPVNAPSNLKTELGWGDISWLNSTKIMVYTTEVVVYYVGPDGASAIVRYHN